MLDEPILALDTQDGVILGTLPDALARLCDGSLRGFEGLAAHQQHPMILFLSQVAALALLQSGKAGAAEDNTAWRALADPVAWRARLAATTPGCADTAWSPVVADLTKPAFLQPPIPAGKLDGYAVAGLTPDEIDILVTAKAHDVKPARLAADQLRHWCFALITLQTQQGYSGRGNFGIARMNGGFSSRPMVMRTPGRTLAASFRRGVQAALQARAALLENPDNPFSSTGAGLLWLQSWEREESVALRTLDPLFVEVCRRIRLQADGEGNVVAWGRPSEVPRVAAAKEFKGNLGDAWTPISLPEGAALTVGGGGFDYRLVARLLDGTEFKLPVAMQPRPDDPPEDTWMRMSVLVRGQGKTEGLHERWEQIPPAARRSPGTPQLGALSKAMLLDVAAARGALAFGLRLFVQGGPERSKPDDERPQPFLEAFEQQVDIVFLQHLFGRHAAPEEEEPEQAWKQALVGLAQQAFEEAQARLSPPDARRERAMAVASLAFNRMLRKAGLIETRSETDE